MVSFNDRIKLLRTSYKLSTRELASILDIKAPSIAAWESGKSQPTLEMFKRICNLFAVSADFMLGNSSIAYNGEFLLNLEKLLINYKLYTGDTVMQALTFPNKYLDVESRIAIYSHGMRANIIFLLYMFIAYKNAFAYIDDDIDSIQLHQPYCNQLYFGYDDNKLEGSKYAEKGYLNFCRLKDALSKTTGDGGSQPQPFFDIEKAVKDQAVC